MVGKRGQSEWIYWIDADGIVCQNKAPVACRFVAINTEKGKSHTGRKRKVIIEIEFRFEGLGLGLGLDESLRLWTSPDKRLEQFREEDNDSHQRSSTIRSL